MVTYGLVIILFGLGGWGLELGPEQVKGALNTLPLPTSLVHICKSYPAQKSALPTVRIRVTKYFPSFTIPQTRKSFLRIGFASHALPHLRKITCKKDSLHPRRSMKKRAIHQ